MYEDTDINEDFKDDYFKYKDSKTTVMPSIDKSYLLLILLLTPLLIGTVKAVLGVFWKASVGIWGLEWILYGPYRIKKYRETELENYPVIYNKYGIPIHPITKQHSVRTLPLVKEVIVNCLFCFLLPFAVYVKVIQRWPNYCIILPDNSDEDNEQLINEDTYKVVHSKSVEEENVTIVMNKSQTSIIDRELHVNSSRLQTRKSIDNSSLTSIHYTSSKVSLESRHKMSYHNLSAYLILKGIDAMSKGAVLLNERELYSIKGFLKQSVDESYIFTIEEESYQYWGVDTENTKLNVRLFEPHRLDYDRFMIKYDTLCDLLSDGKIILHTSVFCLNTQTQPEHSCSYSSEDDEFQAI